VRCDGSSLQLVALWSSSFLHDFILLYPRTDFGLKFVVIKIGNGISKIGGAAKVSSIPWLGVSSNPKKSLIVDRMPVRSNVIQTQLQTIIFTSQHLFYILINA
jgi:hypothetical protein